MATIAAGNHLEVYVPVACSVTVTPGIGGVVDFGCSSPGGQLAPAGRRIHTATSVDVPSGSTLFLRAEGADAEYSEPIAGAGWSDSTGTALVRPDSSPCVLPVLPASASDYQSSVLNHASSTYKCVGYDDVDGLAFIRDDTGGVLRQGSSSDSWATTAGASWSTNKTLPTSPNAVLYSSVVRMLRFKGKLYLLAKDSVTNLVGVYRCDPAAGNTAFSWSTPVHQMLSTVASALWTCFHADADYLWLGEYGDPTGGPTVWRSADGTTWTQIYTEVGQSPAMRHMHAIASDPYAPGDVYMTLGDGNAARTVLVSHDHGDTWSVLAASATWQAVQISFSSLYVWFAGDSNRGHVWALVRATGALRWVCAGLMKNQAVPAAAASTDQFFHNGYFGTVDPATEEYYFSLVNDGAGGNTAGLCIVPFPGASPVLIDKLATNELPVFIAAGFIWFGKYRRPLHLV